MHNISQFNLKTPLTHHGWVMHICTKNHWFRLWLVAYLGASHYLNQSWWHVVNLTLQNTFQWNLKQDTTILTSEMHFKLWSAKCQPFFHGLNVSTLLMASHYNDIIMSMAASQITSISIVCSTVGSGTHQRKHQSSVSQAFVTQKNVSISWRHHATLSDWHSTEFKKHMIIM